ncbi:hypothetical protein ACFQ10_46280 [Streptomyces indonesiensis]
MGLTRRIRRLLDALTRAAMLGLASWLAVENQSHVRRRDFLRLGGAAQGASLPRSASPSRGM